MESDSCPVSKLEPPTLDMNIIVQNISDNTEEMTVLNGIQAFLNYLMGKIKSTMMDNLQTVLLAIPEMLYFDYVSSTFEDCIHIIATKTRIIPQNVTKPSNQQMMRILLESSLSYEKWKRILTTCVQLSNIQVKEDYINSVNILTDLEQGLLMSSYVREEKPIQQMLNNYLKNKKTVLAEILKKVWSDIVSCKKTANDGAILSLLQDHSKAILLVESMEKLKIFNKSLGEFRKEFNECIIKPLLDNNILINEMKTKTHNILEFVILDSCRVKMSKPELSLKNMGNLLHFLSDSFFSNTLRGSPILKWFVDRKTSTLSNEIADRCILPAMLNESMKNNQFTELLNISTNFHKLLAEFEIVNPDDESSILKNKKFYKEQIGIKLCKHYIAQAIEYLNLGLQPVFVSTEDIKLDTIKSKSNVFFGSCKIEDPLKFCFCYAKNIENFPASKISYSIQKFLFVVEAIFMDIIRISSTCNPCYFEALNTILTYYLEESNNIYCREIDKDSPQKAAIYYNNCMIVSKYLYSFRNAATIHFDLSLIHSVCIQYAPEYRNLGLNFFLIQMKLQKDHLNELIRIINEAHTAALPKMCPRSKAEDLLRSCIFYLLELKQDWYTFLPDSMYVKSMETLVNHVLEQIIKTVTGASSVEMPSAILISSTLESLISEIHLLCQAMESKQITTKAKNYEKSKAKIKNSCNKGFLKQSKKFIRK